MHKGFNKFQKTLIVFSILIILFFAITSIIALKTGKANLNHKNESNTRLSPNNTNTDTNISTNSLQSESFVNFGTIRGITGDIPGIPLVLQIQLPYETDDTPFFEELMQKKLKFIDLTLNYFNSQSFHQLTAKGEETVKQELLEFFNKELVLGQIDKIFFTEYIFLD